MKLLNVSDITPKGMPLYEMREIFEATANKGSKIMIEQVTLIPGERVPKEGFSCHTGDEYSVFTSGEVYTESGDFKGTLKEGMATFIPLGEKHFCINKTDSPCTLLCVMVTPDV